MALALSRLTAAFAVVSVTRKASHGSAFSRALAAAMARLRSMAAIRQQRHALARLDAHLLRDIGVTPAQARAEADRPAWDAPGHWRA